VSASQPIRWEDSNPAKNLAGKQALCVADFIYKKKCQILSYRFSDLISYLTFSYTKKKENNSYQFKIFLPNQFKHPKGKFIVEKHRR